MDTIAIGTRFQHTSPPFFQWEVERVITDLEGLPHAHLVRVDSPKDRRMISALALQNDRLYHKVGKDGTPRRQKPRPRATDIFRRLSCFFA